MTVRTDLTYNLNLSPRLITVQAPSTEITIQDLVDTTRIFEAESASMDDGHLINAAGKEELGGGVLVGITATLQNAQIAFEGRDVATSAGTATSNNAAGTLLIDIGATFIADGVTRGATIINCTTGASAEVISVTANELIITTLESGSRQTWLIGDEYTVHIIIQCQIDGGNLTSIDNVGASLAPVFTTAYTQIVRTASSSATLQELNAIQFSSFNGGVTVDLASSNTGTAFPTGTPEQPVNNFPDALLIAASRGFTRIFVIGNATLDGGVIFDGFTIQGQSEIKSSLTLDTTASFIGTEFEDATIAGVLDGDAHVTRCSINDLSVISGDIEHCVLNGTITLSGATSTRILDCWSGVPGALTPTINMGGSGQSLAMRNYSGGITITNRNGTDAVSLDINSGQVIIDSTVTAGTIIIRGIGKLIDNSTGTAIIDSDDLIQGALLKLIERLLRNKTVLDPATGKFEVYDDAGVLLLSGDAFEDAAGTTPYGPASSQVERRERLT